MLRPKLMGGRLNGFNCSMMSSEVASPEFSQGETLNANSPDKERFSMDRNVGILDSAERLKEL